MIIGRCLRASCPVSRWLSVAGRTRPVRAVADAVEADADRAGQVDWQLSVDSTISRAHQHAANLPREVALQLPSHTGGAIELQETPGRTC